MFLVEQTGIGSRNMVFNKIADVLDLDDLVLERAEEITIARAMRLGLPFINASKNVNIIRIDNIKEYIFSYDDLFCMWTPTSVELALNNDYYAKIFISGKDAYLGDEVICRYCDCIGFPHRMVKNGNLELNLYSMNRFEYSISIKDAVVYMKNAGKMLKKSVLLQRRE